MTHGDKFNYLLAYSAGNPQLNKEIIALHELRISSYIAFERTHAKIMKIIDEIDVIELCILFTMRLFAERNLEDLSVADAELRCLEAIENDTIFRVLVNFTPADLGLPENLACATNAAKAAYEKYEKSGELIKSIDLTIYKILPDMADLSIEQIMDEFLRVSGELAIGAALSKSRKSIKKLVNSSPDLDEISKVLDLDKI